MLEDFARFVQDDRFLTAELKALRHELAESLDSISIADRLTARDTQGDVGTGLTTPAEEARDDAAAIVTANFLRLEEALRSLEEFGKLLDSGVGAAMKRLRYRAYVVHKAFVNIHLSFEKLRQSRLYVLLDGRASREEFAALAHVLVAAGVDLLQLRDKQLDDRVLLDRAHTLRDVTHGTQTLFIVNDRADLALLSRADGVHLGQDELTVKDARRIVGPDAIVGVSTHSIEQARRAVLDGANYIGVGPTFASQTKAFQEFTGLSLLRAVSAETCLPAFAIGGVDEGNLDQVRTSGFTRVAVSGAVLLAADPAATASRLAARLKAGTG